MSAGACVTGDFGEGRLAEAIAVLGHEGPKGRLKRVNTGGGPEALEALRHPNVIPYQTYPLGDFTAPGTGAVSLLHTPPKVRLARPERPVETFR
jgi:hypothetical protein